MTKNSAYLLEKENRAGKRSPSPARGIGAPAKKSQRASIKEKTKSVGEKGKVGWGKWKLEWRTVLVVMLY